jgi:hypothetical protein
MSEKRDKGHEQLVHDIEALLALAKGYEFHDSKGRRSHPKAHLHKVLEIMRDRIAIGLYDNN